MLHCMVQSSIRDTGIVALLALADVKQRLAGLGAEPMPMHSAAAPPIAISMLGGASRQRMPESCAKKAKYGILIPA